MKRFDLERQEMISLLRERGIVDEQLLLAMGHVERQLFVPEPFTPRSYEDNALPIGKGQTISHPYTVAFMTQVLEVRKGDKVLEIGTGSGYQSAILAAIGAHVFSIERDRDLLASARRILDRLGYRVASKTGDGSVGWEEYAPYAGIIVTAAAPDVPRSLMSQLADGGRLVVPVGTREIQSLAIITRSGDHFDRRHIDSFKFVPLVGKDGWQEMP